MASLEAPGGLAAVQRFINTADLESDADELQEPSALRIWLSENVADPGPVTGAGLVRAQRLREALRALAAANNGEPLDADALAVIDRAARVARLRPRFTAGGVELAPGAGGLEGALGRLVAVVCSAMADGSWRRLKACARHSCRWAFYDSSRNQSGTWCSMRVCGNRSKVERFRERRRDEVGSDRRRGVIQPTPTVTET